MATWLNQLQAIISHDKNLYLEDQQLADSFFKKGQIWYQERMQYRSKKDECMSIGLFSAFRSFCGILPLNSIIVELSGYFYCLNQVIQDVCTTVNFFQLARG